MAWPPTVHQDVTDEITGAQGWATSLATRNRIGEPTMGAPLTWVAGRYYSANLTASITATTTPGADIILLLPVYFVRSRAVDRVASNVSTAGAAGALARMGIYNASPVTGLPTTVLYDSGTVAADTTGVKEVVATVTVSGLCWMGLATQSGAFTGQGTNATAATVGAPSVPSAPQSGLSYPAPVASALPDLSAAVPSFSAGTLPSLWLRAA